jgi:hypothetical protein
MPSLIATNLQLQKPMAGSMLCRGGAGAAGAGLGLGDGLAGQLLSISAFSSR